MIGSGLAQLTLGVLWWSLLEMLATQGGCGYRTAGMLALALAGALLVAGRVLPLARDLLRNPALARVASAVLLVGAALVTPHVVAGPASLTAVPTRSGPGFGLVAFGLLVLPAIASLRALEGAPVGSALWSWPLLALWPALSHSLVEPLVPPISILAGGTALLGVLAWPAFRPGKMIPATRYRPDERGKSREEERKASLSAELAAGLIAALLGAGLAGLHRITLQQVADAGSTAGLALGGTLVAGLIGWSGGRLSSSRGRGLVLVVPLALGAIGLLSVPRWAAVLARPDGREAFEALLGPAGESPFVESALLVAALIGWYALIAGGIIAWTMPGAGQASDPGQARAGSSRIAAGLAGLGVGELLLAWVTPTGLVAWLAPTLPAAGALVALRAPGVTRRRRWIATTVVVGSLATGWLLPTPIRMARLARLESWRPFVDPGPVWTPDGLLVTERITHAETDLIAYRLDGNLLLAEPSDPSTERLEVTVPRALASRRPSIVVFDGYATPRHIEALGDDIAVHVIRPLLACRPDSAGDTWLHAGGPSPGLIAARVLPGLPPGDRPWQVIMPPISPAGRSGRARLTREALGRVRQALPAGSLVTLVLDPGLFPPRALMTVVKTFRAVFGRAALRFTETSFESARLFLSSDPSARDAPWSACSRDALLDGLIAIDRGLDELTRDDRVDGSLDPLLSALVWARLPPDPIIRLAPTLRTLDAGLDRLEGPAAGATVARLEPRAVQARWRATRAALRSLILRCGIKPYSWFRAYGDRERLEIPVDSVRVLLRGLEQRPGDATLTARLEELLDVLLDRGRYEKIETALSDAIEPTLPWPGASYFLGRTYLDVLEPRLALPHLERAWMLSPSYRDVEVLLGLALLHSGEEVRAREILKRAWEAGRVPPRDLAAVGAALLEVGERRAGIDALRAAVAENPHDLETAARLEQAEGNIPSGKAGDDGRHP